MTASYTATLHETLRAIRDALPPDKPVVDVQEILSTQVHWTTEMANQLVGLAEHFEKMELALKDSEAGEQFGDDDIQGNQSRAFYICVVIQAHFKRWCEMLRNCPSSLPSWKMLGRSWIKACVSLSARLRPTLELTLFEARSSYRPSKHLSNICRNMVLPSKTSRN